MTEKAERFVFIVKVAEAWFKWFCLYNSAAHEVCGWELSRHQPHLYDREELHGPQTVRHGDVRQPWQTRIWWEDLNISPPCTRAEIKLKRRCHWTKVHCVAHVTLSSDVWRLSSTNGRVSTTSQGRPRAPCINKHSDLFW